MKFANLPGSARASALKKAGLLIELAGIKDAHSNQSMLIYNGFVMDARVMLLALIVPAMVWAEEVASPVTSVEENIHNMDRDHDGMVTIAEIRAYLEAQNGKDYRRELLDEMAAKAEAKSCASPFSRSFY